MFLGHISITFSAPCKAYPEPLRRVSYHDPVTDHRLKLLTNNFALPALTIADIHRCRWQAELFLKGSSSASGSRPSMEPARTSCWRSSGSGGGCRLQALSVPLSEKVPVLQALHASDSQDNLTCPDNQLILFDF
jgi:hypothetical protein